MSVSNFSRWPIVLFINGDGDVKTDGRRGSTSAIPGSSRMCKVFFKVPISFLCLFAMLVCPSWGTFSVSNWGDPPKMSTLVTMQKTMQQKLSRHRTLWKKMISFLSPARRMSEDNTIHVNIEFYDLTHCSRDKMAATLQTTHSNAFSWMKMLEFRLQFNWSLFLRVQATIFQHWFR